MALIYRTTDKSKALAFCRELRRAGYEWQKVPNGKFVRIPPMTFRTMTFASSEPKPRYWISYAYSTKAPVPPRRRHGRSTCSVCFTRKIRAHGLCDRCTFKKRYHSEPEFRAFSIERSKAKLAELYKRPEWRERRRKYQAEWGRKRRAKLKAQKAERAIGALTLRKAA